MRAGAAIGDDCCFVGVVSAVKAAARPPHSKKGRRLNI
jgi:hypothetical protein